MPSGGVPDAEEPSDPSIIRDVGIFPRSLATPSGRVRCYLSGPRILFEHSMTVGISLLGLALLFFIPTWLPDPLNWLGVATAVVGFVAMIDLGTRSVYRWVELDGTTLRAKQLLTGRVTERDVAEVLSVDTLILKVRQAETVMIESLLGRVQGVDVRFRGARKPLRIRRVDPAMHNAETLIEAMLDRMQQIGELETDFIDLDGTPVVGSVYWKGHRPSPPSASGFYLACACVTMIVGLFFGTILGNTARHRLAREAILSVAPQELPLAALVKQGPGNNPHITLTDFRAGQPVSESDNGTWTRVWVPLFPSKDAADEIPCVLESTVISSEDDCERLLRPGRITGVCSDVPRTSWGSRLGPDLVNANQNRPLTAAWVVEDAREPPHGNRFLIASGVAFSLAIFCGVFVLGVRS
jgi:hypothetical protein